MGSVIFERHEQCGNHEVPQKLLAFLDAPAFPAFRRETRNGSYPGELCRLLGSPVKTRAEFRFQAPDIEAIPGNSWNQESRVPTGFAKQILTGETLQASRIPCQNPCGIQVPSPRYRRNFWKYLGTIRGNVFWGRPKLPDLGGGWRIPGGVDRNTRFGGGVADSRGNVGGGGGFPQKLLAFLDAPRFSRVPAGIAKRILPGKTLQASRVPCQNPCGIQVPSPRYRRNPWEYLGTVLRQRFLGASKTARVGVADSRETRGGGVADFPQQVLALLDAPLFSQGSGGNRETDLTRENSAGFSDSLSKPVRNSGSKPPI